MTYLCDKFEFIRRKEQMYNEYVELLLLFRGRTAKGKKDNLAHYWRELQL